MKDKKKCPFSGKHCVKEECVLFDDELGICELKDLAKFIGECFTDLIKELTSAIEDKDHD